MRLHLGLGMVHALVENYKVRLLGLCAGNYTLLSLRKGLRNPPRGGCSDARKADTSMIRSSKI